jgi:hypothetical protein
MPILVFGLVGLALFRPKLFRKLLGQIEPLKVVRTKPVEIDYGKPPEREPAKPGWADITAEEMIARSKQLAEREQLARREQLSQAEQPRWRAPPPSAQSAPVFGRRRV